MRRAWLNLRYTVPERVQAFAAGLKRHGFEVLLGCPNQERDGDVLVTWNRIGPGEAAATRFESKGLRVLVAENAAWGNGFNGERWYSVARNRHNTAGRFEYGGPERWDSLLVSIDPIRIVGETLILPQRGIGSAPTAMPRDWALVTEAKYRCRVRHHPGQRPCLPLFDDLRSVRRVITWGSGAAILAALWGCEVVWEMPDWIGAHDNTDDGRLEMFRKLAWAQWRLGEIESGEAFARLL